MPKVIKSPPDEVLRKLRRYRVDAENGRIFNIKGQEVFIGTTLGYHVMGIYHGSPLRQKKLKRAHVIWWAYYGKWPERMLDHIDRSRTNDSITNLRYTDYSQNAYNSDWSTQAENSHA